MSAAAAPPARPPLSSTRATPSAPTSHPSSPRAEAPSPLSRSALSKAASSGATPAKSPAPATIVFHKGRHKSRTTEFDTSTSPARLAFPVPPNTNANTNANANAKHQSRSDRSTASGPVRMSPRAPAVGPNSTAAVASPVPAMRWTKITPPGPAPRQHVDTDRPIPRLSHTATQVGSYLFICGGHDGVKYSSEILLLNLVTLGWETRKVVGGPPKGRGYHTAVMYDSRMFTFGGYDGDLCYGEFWLLDLGVFAYLPQITSFEVGKGV
ncbi:hypothetical protein SeMB42_g03302 [Synchytrium endobioticum]|uniref:Uncharacterized protein n=1 Tax=Synchytrium endobioticum TaxID=286115 RepID=A0A507D7M3_9FUNG|nr:hypothetical protein SeMB42_g03302 [Synchytrium endobioticum]